MKMISSNAGLQQQTAAAAEMHGASLGEGHLIHTLCLTTAVSVALPRQLPEGPKQLAGIGGMRIRELHLCIVVGKAHA